jgi:hypothetical protein
VALNECGKNFDAIQLFFQNKGKKGKTAAAPPAPGSANTAASSFKHKDQIRCQSY